MPRFVILAHDWPTPHLDLLLERDGVLKAWRLPPDFDPTSATTSAEANFDHRLHYLDYEGPVSGDRGTVRRWDAGQVAWELAGDGRAVVVLSGVRLGGHWEFVRIDGDHWHLRHLSAADV